jgi:hypothetical protein
MRRRRSASIRRGSAGVAPAASILENAMENSINMLTLYTRIRGDEDVQNLARQLRQGFTREVWDTLAEFQVLDARITALPKATADDQFDALLLCTTFQMPNLRYQEVFFRRFPGTFVKLALAAIDSPFTAQPLTQAQVDALRGGDESAENRALLQPLFDTVRHWIDAHDLTLDMKPTKQPQHGQRNQFHLTLPSAGSDAGGWASRVTR